MRRRFFTKDSGLAYALAFAALLVVFAAPSRSEAHPLGNFTLNHLSRLTVSSRRVDVRYVLDMAEIPTVALEHALNADGTPSAEQYAAWGRAHAVEIAPQLQLLAGSTSLELVPGATTVRTRPGAAGLRTIYFTAEYRAALPPGTRTLAYFDHTEAGRLGVEGRRPRTVRRADSGVTRLP